MSGLASQNEALAFMRGQSSTASRSKRDGIHRSEHMSSRTIIDAFSQIVVERGRRPAVRHDGRVITYAELDERSNVLAAHLVSVGVRKEAVAVMYAHGPEYIIALLAVLKAGGFFATIAGDLKPARKKALLENIGARVLLHDAEYASDASHMSMVCSNLCIINTEEQNYKGTSLAFTNCPISAEDWAYIVFTSGSMGDPKGVPYTHQNVLNLAEVHGRAMALNDADRALQACLLWTAASGSEIFSALLNCTVLYPFSLVKKGFTEYLRTLDREEITTFVVTPSMFRALLGSAKPSHVFSSVRLIRMGGERVGRKEIELFKRHFKLGTILRVGYGSSEYLLATQTLVDHHYELDGDIVPAGYPMEGTECWIEDEHGEILGPNSIGEICISSPNLCVGYWNNAKLTAERFKNTDRPNRTYYTRDIGYIDDRGCLHHLGRKDGLTKISGKLISTTEIESKVMAILGSERVAVVPFEDNVWGNQLALFLIIDKNVEFDEVALRRMLRTGLPNDAIPRRIFVLDEFPLTSNYKIDRAALVAKLHTNAGAKSSQPCN